MDRNKREVSFELGKEIEKDGFFCQTRILHTARISNFFFVPHL